MRNLASYAVGKYVNLGMLPLLWLGSLSLCRAQEPTPAPTPKDVEVVSTIQSQSSGNKWALLIGINEYEQAAELRFCVDDMRLLAESLVRVAGYKPARIGFLSSSAEIQESVKDFAALPAQRNRQAELVDIKNTWRALLQDVQPADTLLIAFSGHGAVDAAGNTYLLTANGDPQNLAETAVSVSWLLEQIRQCKAAHKLVILDACHSGGAVDLVESLRQEAPQIAAGTEASHPGVVLLTSCLGNQLSYELPRDEDDDLRQGLFCHFIVQAFSGAPAADTNNDDQVTAVEAYVFAREGVQRIVRDKRLSQQTPAWKVISGSPNFVIAPRKEVLTPNTNLDLQTLPGLTGGWWFDEMPLLVPRVRLQMPEKYLKEVTATPRPPKYKKEALNVLQADIQGVKRQLEEGARELIGSDVSTEHLMALKRPSGEPAAVRKRLLEEFQKLAEEKCEAVDYHLAAILYSQLRSNAEADELFAKALRLYRSGQTFRKQKGLFALCRSDFAQHLYAKGEYEQAVEEYDAARSVLGKEVPPAFDIYCRCAQANLLRELGQWEAADEELSAALKIAETDCPQGHPLQAHVYERSAWFNMDRWNVATAKTLFERALSLRQGNLADGDTASQTFVFQNRHGQLMSYRYLGGLPQQEIEKQYSQLGKEIGVAIQQLDRPSGGTPSARIAIRKKELLTRLVNTYERMADLRLFSCEPTTLLTDLINFTKPQSNQDALQRAKGHLTLALARTTDGALAKEAGNALPRLYYKQAIVHAFWGNHTIAKGMLREADKAQQRMVDESTTSSTTAEGRAHLEPRLYPDLAYCLVNLARSAAADSQGKLLNLSDFEQQQDALRSRLREHIDAHQQVPKKRDDVELMLLAAGVLTASHAWSGSPAEVRSEDINRLTALTQYLNSSPPQLRRYLRPYYCVAIRVAFNADVPDNRLVSDLMLSGKYGKPLFIFDEAPVLIFFTDGATMSALSRVGEQWSTYRDCLELLKDKSDGAGGTDENGERVVPKESFERLIKALGEGHEEIQLFWSDPDLRIQKAQFPRVANERLKFRFLPDEE